LEDKAELLYHDPFVEEIELKGRRYRSVQLNEALLKSVDLVLIATDHSSVDYRKLVDTAPIILDTRNATRGYPGVRIRLFYYKTSVPINSATMRG